MTKILFVGNSYTFYKNLSEELPEGIVEGAKVVMGQKIATVGDAISYIEEKKN